MQTALANKLRIIKRLELIELLAWLELYSIAADSVPGRYLTFPCGDSVAAIIPTVDILAFNKVASFGLKRPIRSDDLFELKHRMMSKGVKRFFIQLPPHIASKNINLLSDHGFNHYNSWRKLYIKPIELQETKNPFEIKEVDRKNADEFSAVVLRCFEWHENLLPLFASSVESKNWKHYAAFDGKRIVACAAMFVQNTYSWFGFAATLPQYRKLGLQSGLLLKRIQTAYSLGIKTAVLETAEDTPGKPSISLKNAQKVGFKSAYSRLNFIYTFKY